MKKILIIVVIAGSLSANIFQLSFTPNTTLESGRTVNFVHTMIYPYTNKTALDIGRQHNSDELLDIEEYYVVHKGIKTDLKKTLEDVKFKVKDKSAKAYKSKHRLKKMGDHLFVLEPSPYYSQLEGIYLQQITKTIVNIAGKPTDWDRELGLKAEIIPLSKPYGIWSGSSFSAMVKAEGIPVPFAHIEIEYLNSDMDMKNLKMGKFKTNEKNQNFKTIEIKANENGEFTFHLPRQGWWGFKATHVGLKKDYKQKELSIDAVIWVQVKDVK